ncbi:MAG: hypothetical protein JSV84_10580 [Gemmatimonadota bacterium]|nr:MAG: hypothetical protein JSV84_10580 [Gemmatimonadota bacterium]
MLRSILFSTLVCMILAGFAWAQIPQTMSYQGMLKDGAGNPVADSTVTMTFKLYDVEEEGTALWQEIREVEITDGLYHVILGGENPLNLPFDKPYWLGITVATEEELTPRYALTSSPYSLNAVSTIVEPVAGQDLVILNTEGEQTHILSQNGDVAHEGKGTFEGGVLINTGTDTMMSIIDTGDGYLYVGSDTTQTLGKVPSSKPDSYSEIDHLRFNPWNLQVPVLLCYKLIAEKDGGGFAVEARRPNGSGILAESVSNPAIKATSVSGNGILAESQSLSGVYGKSQSDNGVFGESESYIGVYGKSVNHVGVYGESSTSNGVIGESESQPGVAGLSQTGSGVYGKSTDHYGLRAYSENDIGLFSTGGKDAAQFDGDVRIEASGKLKIDNVPVDPNEEKFLVWSSDKFVKYRTLPGNGGDEAWLLDGDNIFVAGKNVLIKDAEGNVTTQFNADGTSTHKGPETFEGDVLLKDSRLSFLSSEGIETTVLDAEGALFPHEVIFDGGILVQADTANDKSAHFTGGVDVRGEISAKSFHIVTDHEDTLISLNADGTSLHKGIETFKDDVILKGTDGKGIKLVDSEGVTLAGFGRKDLDTGQRFAVYGKAETEGDLAGAFDGDVEVRGEIYASSLHIVNDGGDTLTSLNADGTSNHKGLETYEAGLSVPLGDGKFIDINPELGIAIHDREGDFCFHANTEGDAMIKETLFVKNCIITGAISKPAGQFKIDHPLDPENKFLGHSFVESPDMMNIYNGNVALDEAGEAWVELPDWFGALNKDFRYQLTPIGAPGPKLYIAEEIQNNRFKIAGGRPGMKVSWQVTGIRQDAFAEANRIQVEEDKSPEHRGTYLHPECFGKPESSRLSYKE